MIRIKKEKKSYGRCLYHRTASIHQHPSPGRIPRTCSVAATRRRRPCGRNFGCAVDATLSSAGAEGEAPRRQEPRPFASGCRPSSGAKNPAAGAFSCCWRPVDRSRRARTSTPSALGRGSCRRRFARCCARCCGGTGRRRERGMGRPFFRRFYWRPLSTTSGY